MQKRHWLGWISFVAFPVLLFILLLIFLLFQPGELNDAEAVVVPRGSSILSVSEMLHQHKVIRHPKIFRWLLRLTHGSTKVRAGEFLFVEKTKMMDALLVLYYGEPIVHQVTIPEGWTVRQIAEALTQAKLISETKFVELAFSKDTAARFKLDAPTIEVFFFRILICFQRSMEKKELLSVWFIIFLKSGQNNILMKAEEKGGQSSS